MAFIQPHDLAVSVVKESSST